MVSGRSFTGPVAAALEDVRALLAAGHSAWLGSCSGSALETGCAAQSVPFTGGFRFGKGPARLLHLPRDARRLREVCAELNVQVVHVHRSHEQVLVRWGLGRRARSFCVRTWHRAPAALAGPLRRQMAATCGACLCVSREHIEALEKVGARNVVYLPPGVDTGRYRPIGKTRGEVCRIGLVGRWRSGEDRGQRTFLEVLRRASGSTAWRGVILGRGEDRGELEKLIAAHPHRERLELEEAGDAFPERVAALDVGLVFATGSDGTSRPALEMLACGVPLLLADLPGLRELGEENAGARVLPAGDPDAWARAVEAWLASPEERRRVGQAARKMAEERHALAVRGRRLAEFYSRAQ